MSISVFLSVYAIVLVLRIGTNVCSCNASEGNSSISMRVSIGSPNDLVVILSLFGIPVNTNIYWCQYI